MLWTGVAGEKNLSGLMEIISFISAHRHTFQEYFKQTTGDGNLYVIRHDLETDAWEMVMTETIIHGKESG